VRAISDQAGANLGQPGFDIGNQRLWNGEALRAAGLRILGMEEQVDLVADELEVTADRQRRETASPDRPQGDERDQQPVAILQLARPGAVDGRARAASISSIP
jgi:hypothetical protein